jgi:hypothetical protein
MKIVYQFQYNFTLTDLIDLSYCSVQTALYCQHNGLLYLADIIAYLKNPYNNLRVFAIRNKGILADLQQLLDEFDKSSFPPHFERVPCRIGLNMRRLTEKNQKFLMAHATGWIRQLSSTAKKWLDKLMPETSREEVEKYLFDRSRDWRTYASCNKSTMEELITLQLRVIRLFNGLQTVQDLAKEQRKRSLQINDGTLA